MKLLRLFLGKQPFLSLMEYMQTRKLSRQELAIKLNVSESYLSLYFSGKRTFGAQTALRISRITGIPIENLIK